MLWVVRIKYFHDICQMIIRLRVFISHRFISLYQVIDYPNKSHGLFNFQHPANNDLISLGFIVLSQMESVAHQSVRLTRLSIPLGVHAVSNHICHPTRTL